MIFPTTHDFVPGGIHSPDVQTFWQSTLMASPWVLSILKDGYSIPFVTTPLQYEEPNNASVLRNVTIVQDLLNDMVLKGIVSLVESKPLCVSPLGLVTKMGPEGPKYRLIFDASRCVNLHVNPPRVKLSFLQKAL